MIKIKVTSKDNANYYNVNINDVIQIPLTDYLIGVVASEIGNAHIEACKAQAVASRTAAYPYYSTGKVISDSSSSVQAFRAQRITGYQNAINAVHNTEWQLLCYNGTVCSPCSFSNSNGGRTTSSQQRWGGYRAWLIEQDDPWDKVAKTGHGVGMSQAGAKYAASIGKTYEQILSFYYPNTNIQRKEESVMISSTDLIAKFQQALREKWGYIYGSAGIKWTQAKQDATTNEMAKKYGQKWVGKTVADCSGLFVWAFKQLGGTMYHGSNTMFNKWCVANGTLNGSKRSDGQQLKPGTALFKYNATDGYHHVGLYVGDDTVIEAKGTINGVISSKVNTWSHWGQLKGVAYTAQSFGNEPKLTVYAPSGTTVNMRSDCNSKATVICKIPIGQSVSVIEKGSQWAKISYQNKVGYMKTQFLKQEEKELYAIVSAPTGSTVNMRKSSSTSSSILCKIPIGSKVQVLQQQAEWTMIKHNAIIGYMLNRFLTNVG